jgi:heterodisulfide reductase subunit A
VLIVGAGLAGAAAARELAASGRQVLLAEKSGAVGGKVRNYGCKASSAARPNDKCANCGLCLANDLWDDVEKNNLIDIRLHTKLADLCGEKGNYTAALKCGGAISYESQFSDVLIASGFKGSDFNGFAEIENTGSQGAASLITGSEMELVMKRRGETKLFEKIPEKIAFIQCFGSRDIKENAMYCSRVCCGYSTRAAKVIKQYYPGCSIIFFYMEMQQVRNGNYFDELKQLGENFIKCRPVKIKDASAALVAFDKPDTGRREEQSFDYVVLADGIRPSGGAAKIAEICGLGQTGSGFLKYVKDINYADRTGIYIVGCAKGPAKIEEVYADSIATARRILFKEKSTPCGLSARLL